MDFKSCACGGEAFLSCLKPAEAEKLTKKLMFTGTVAELQEALAVVAAVSAERWEVRCGECSAHVVEGTEARVIGVWNRAVDKWYTLKPCCKLAHNQDRHTDHMGSGLVKCKECGIRHFPMGDKKEEPSGEPRSTAVADESVYRRMLRKFRQLG